MTSPAEKPVCSVCGSEDVTKDAWASWDIEAQDWVLHSVYDDTFCQTCEESQKVNWIPAGEDEDGSSAGTAGSEQPDRPEGA